MLSAARTRSTRLASLPSLITCSLCAIACAVQLDFSALGISQSIAPGTVGCQCYTHPAFVQGVPRSSYMAPALPLCYTIHEAGRRPMYYWSYALTATSTNITLGRALDGIEG